MNLAIEEAKKAYLIDEVPVGSVLVNNSDLSIISMAHNEMIKTRNPINHAEILVISKACKFLKSKYLNDTSIFITLEPCLMCAAAISEAQIKNIFFGAYDNKKGSLESIMSIYKTKNLFVPEIFGGVKEKICSKLLVDFFKGKRS